LTRRKLERSRKIDYRLQTSIQTKVIAILWKVGGNRRRRGSPAASGTSGWLLFELELLDCHNTHELTLIRMCLLRLGPLRCHVSITGNGIGRAETKI